MDQAQEWSGQLWLGRDYGLVFGKLGRTTPHAHYAHQLIIATGQPVTLELDGVTRTGQQMFIESMRPHAIIEAADQVFSLYAEPLMFDAHVLQAHVRAVEPTLPDLDLALQLCPRRQLDDPRIVRALAALDNLLSGKVAAASLAEQANVSLSQLERLFAQQVGLPVRRLVLWRRLRLAMALLLSGHNVTAAAHEAGFADSAHLSRSLKKIFGVTASQGLGAIDICLRA